MKTIIPTPPVHYTFDPENQLRLIRCWHPVTRARDITSAPVEATLLGGQLVIYRIKSQVVVARDVCPHREVPLTLESHGEGDIVCPYHGLRFGEDGRCNRVLSSPGQSTPVKPHLTSFAVEERYELIWTCLACDPDNSPPLPTMPHWDDTGSQQVNCSVFRVRRFAGRQVEGFLDAAHPAQIHADTFADSDNQQVPDYTPQETPFDFTASYWSSAGNYPASSDFYAPEGFQWLRHFETHLPFTATLTIHFSADTRPVTMNATSSVSSRVTRMFTLIARNSDLYVLVEDVHAFNLRVFEEDHLMIEAQRSERLPLDLTLEAHIPADRSSVTYRRGLKKMGFGDFFLV